MALRLVPPGGGEWRTGMNDTPGMAVSTPDAFYELGLAARPDPATVTPERWRAYLYLRANARGWVTESWYHRMGCRRFIIVQRHTETSEVRDAAPAACPGQAGP